VRLPKFEYFEPATVDEASSILLDRPGAKILAGGTDLLVNMKHRVETPAVLVNIKKIPNLSYVRSENGGLAIGALTRLKKVFGHPDVADRAGALAGAASSVGSYHHQTMGTLGGNVLQQTRCKFFNQSKWWRSSRPLCYKAGGEMCYVVNKKETCFSSYCGDVAPALLVLDASATLSGANGTRSVKLSELYSGEGRKPLQIKLEETLTEITIPAESLRGISVYRKVANRESIDFPIVGAAVWASFDKKEYRVAYTAVDRKPVRALKAEELLNGEDLNDALLDEAAALAAKEATPVKSSLYAPSYKRKMMGTLLKTSLRELMGRAGQ